MVVFHPIWESNPKSSANIDMKIGIYIYIWVDGIIKVDQLFPYFVGKNPNLQFPTARRRLPGRCLKDGSWFPIDFSTKNRSTPRVITSNSLCEKKHVIFKQKLLYSQPHWFATFETMEFQIYIYPLFLEEWRSTINPGIKWVIGFCGIPSGKLT